MVQIIFFVVGITALFLKRLSVTSGVSEIRRPRTFVLGGMLIVIGFLWPLVHKVMAPPTGDYSLPELVVDILVILTPLVAIVFLKQPQAVDHQP